MKEVIDLVSKFQTLLSAIVLSAATSLITAIFARRGTMTKYKDNKFREISDTVYGPLCKKIIDLNLDGIKYDICSIKIFIDFWEIISNDHFLLIPMNLYLKGKKLKEYVELFEQSTGSMSAKCQKKVFMIFNEISVIIFSSYDICRKRLKYPTIRSSVQTLAMPIGKYMLRLLGTGFIILALGFYIACVLTRQNLFVIFILLSILIGIVLLKIENQIYKY